VKNFHDGKSGERVMRRFLTVQYSFTTIAAITFNSFQVPVEIMALSIKAKMSKEISAGAA
jgi:hypothetical protein